MSRLIALIRGINVSGTRKLPMADLRAASAAAGRLDASLRVVAHGEEQTAGPTIGQEQFR